jgi:hypothetical protein
MALKYYIILQKNDIVHSQKSSIWNTSKQIPNENGIYKKQNYIYHASCSVLKMLFILLQRKKYPF